MFDPGEYVEIIKQFNGQRLVTMAQYAILANKPMLDLMHIGMDAMDGDRLGNQSLSVNHFNQIATNHRALCDRYGIPTVSFSEGGYTQVTKELFRLFFKSLGAQCVSSVVRNKPNVVYDRVEKIDECRFRDPYTGVIVTMKEQQGILNNMEKDRRSNSKKLKLLVKGRETFKKSRPLTGLMKRIRKKKHDRLTNSISLLSGTLMSVRFLRPPFGD
jgi:hypothetical protein